MTWHPRVQRCVTAKSSANEPPVVYLSLCESVVWCLCVCVCVCVCVCGGGRNRWGSWLVIKYQSSAEGPIKTAVGKHQRNQSHETKFTHTHAVVYTHTHTHTHTLTHSYTVEHVWWRSGLLSGLLKIEIKKCELADSATPLRPAL